MAAALAPAGRALVLAVSPLVPAPGRPAQLSEADAQELLGFVEGLSGAVWRRRMLLQEGLALRAAAWTLPAASRRLIFLL